MSRLLLVAFKDFLFEKKVIEDYVMHILIIYYLSQLIKLFNFHYLIFIM